MAFGFFLMVILHMEIQGHQDVAAMVWRNLLIAQGLQAMDALLLTFCVQEVLNFEQWEVERAAEEVPTQDPVEETECFGGPIDK